MAAIVDPDEYDFQEERTRLAVNINTAIAGLGALREFTQPSPTRKRGHSRNKRKRGPQPKVVTNHWYCLPQASSVPKFRNTKTCPVFQAHKAAGYGYPPSSVSESGISKVSIPLSLVEQEYYELIWNLFPVLNRQQFSIFKRDKQGQLVMLENNPQGLKAAQYRSIVFVRVASTPDPASSALASSAVAAAPSALASSAVATAPSALASSAVTAAPSALASSAVAAAPSAPASSAVAAAPSALDSSVVSAAPSALASSGVATAPSALASLSVGVVSSALASSAVAAAPSALASSALAAAPFALASTDVHVITTSPSLASTSSGMIAETPSPSYVNAANNYTPSSSSGEVVIRRRVLHSAPDDDNGYDGYFEPRISETLDENEYDRDIGRRTAYIQNMDAEVLRLEQDAQYHESLRIDQERAADRRQAIELRQRRRQLREEEMKKKLDEIGQEPDNGVAVVFRMPDGRRVTRKFDENLPLKVLFLFLEGKFGLRNIKLLGPERTRIHRSDTSVIKEVDGIVIVDKEDDCTDDNDSIEEEPDDNDSIEEEPEENVDGVEFHMNELERRRQQALAYLCLEKNINVKRCDIIETVLHAYRSNLVLEHHQIHVKIDDEVAEDLSGVTKEMFQLFFSAFADEYLNGTKQKIPNNDHRIYTTDLYRTIGRIICHAYVLCGYWPIQFSKATMSAALTSNVSEQLVLDSFLDILNDRDREVLELLMSGKVEVTTKMRLHILGILSRFDCRVDVNKNNAKEVITNLARAVVIYRVYYEILQLGQGMKTYQNLWTDMKEEHIVQLFRSAMPDTAKVIASVTPNYTEDDVDYRTMEERVISYLEDWIGSLSADELADLLVFWTASNVCLPKQVLKVEFNTLDGAAKRPTAQTCSDILFLSRIYISAQDFAQDMAIVFKKESKVMDAL